MLLLAVIMVCKQQMWNVLTCNLWY